MYHWWYLCQMVEETLCLMEKSVKLLYCQYPATTDMVWELSGVGAVALWVSSYTAKHCPRTVQGVLYVLGTQ